MFDDLNLATLGQGSTAVGSLQFKFVIDIQSRNLNSPPIPKTLWFTVSEGSWGISSIDCRFVPSSLLRLGAVEVAGGHFIEGNSSIAEQQFKGPAWKGKHVEALTKPDPSLVASCRVRRNPFQPKAVALNVSETCKTGSRAWEILITTGEVGKCCQ